MYEIVIKESKEVADANKDFGATIGIIAAVCEVIDFAIDIFDSGGNLPEWMHELPGQIAGLFDKLGKVIEVVATLKVEVRVIVTEELIRLMKAQLSAELQQYSDAARLLSEDPANEAIALATLNEVRPALSKTIRLLVHGYDAAVVHVVPVAMAAEIDISKRLKRPVSERRIALEFYIQYFERMQNPDVDHSYAFALKAAVAEREAIVPVLQGSEWITGRSQVTRQEGHCDYHMDMYVIAVTFMNTPGNPLNGFSGRVDHRPASGWIQDGCDRPDRQKSVSFSDVGVWKAGPDLAAEVARLNGLVRRHNQLTEIIPQLEATLRLSRDALESARAMVER